METINKLTSPNSKFAMPFLYVGIIAVVLSMSNLIFKNQMIGICSHLCNAVALGFIVDSLRKGFNTRNKSLKIWLVITFVLLIVSAITRICVFVSDISGLIPTMDVTQKTWFFTFIEIPLTLFALPMIISFIIIVANYKGAVRLLGTLYLSEFAIGLLFGLCISFFSMGLELNEFAPVVRIVKALFLDLIALLTYIVGYRIIKE